MAADHVNLVEVFSSIQGEGPEIGTRTLFVRLGECDLRCGWCDSPATWLPAKTARIDRPGSGDAGRDEIPNPVPIKTLLAAAKKLGLEDHRWVSLTGGEPLLQPEGLRATLEALRGHGPGIFLETHGLHAEALEKVIDLVDLVSMDWKLASDVRRASDAKGAAVEPFHGQHQRFLEVARRVPRVVVKLVITPSSEDAELDEVFASVARTHPDSCLVLQPVTPFAQVQGRPSAARMHELERRASRLLSEVRVIPQTHPIMEMA